MTKIAVLNEVWNSFIQNWCEIAEKKGFPKIELDPQWPSPCENTSDGVTTWKPVAHKDELTFDNIEAAIDISLNEEYTNFFCMYYSDNLNAAHKGDSLQFLQAWSKADFERLQQNLIGHLMMKSKLKQSPTLFFALTDEDDLNLVVENETGEVWLEYVGQEPHTKVSDSLANFISECTPVL